MKPSLLFVAVLLFASSAKAQHTQHHSATSQSQGYIMSGGGGGEIGSARAALVYEPPRDFKVQYLTYDGPYVPSSYMNYDDALALGRQQLAVAAEYAKNHAEVSLGEIARSYRTLRIANLRLQAKETTSIPADSRSGI